jgi:hypothetical protein
VACICWHGNMKTGALQPSRKDNVWSSCMTLSFLRF